MDVKFFEKWYTGMNKQSEEFQKVFEIVSDTYWTFEDPDVFQKSAKLVNQISTKGEPDDVITMVEIYKMLYKMRNEKLTTVSFELQTCDESKPMYIDMYTSKTEFHAMKKMIENVVVKQSGMRDGNDDEEQTH